MGVWWLVHARRSERAALHYIPPTRCRLCLGGKDGRPTQFNAAIACSVKLTLDSTAFKGVVSMATRGSSRVMETLSLVMRRWARFYRFNNFQ